MGKKYPHYKNSGIEWIGIIPDSWKLEKSKWLFNEKTIKGYPFETLLSVSKGRGLLPREELESRAVMAFKDLENFKLVIPDDFVIHLRSFQSGFELSKVRGIVSPAYTVFSGKMIIHPDYYKFMFYTRGFIDYIASTTQSLRDGKPIAYSTFQEVELPLPSIEEQIGISKFLYSKVRSIDLLINQKEYLLILLEEKRQSMITEAVTKGLNLNVKMKDSGVEWIGEIPEHWEIKKIKYKFDIIKRIQPSEKITVLSLTQKGLKIKDLNDYSGQHAESYEKYQRVEINDYVMNGMDLLTGYIDCSKIEGVTSPDYRVFRLKKSSECHYYFLRYFQICYFAKIFYGHGQGVSNFGRWRLQTDVFKEFPIPVPPVDEQIKISKHLNDIEDDINVLTENIKEQIEKLKKYRQSLIYEAVTGKIDVRDFGVDS